MHEGRKSLQTIFDGTSPFELDQWFAWAQDRIVRNSRQPSYRLDLLRCFTPAQRQILACLLWEIFHLDNCRHRRFRAGYV
jgi:hypothetical protein